MLRDFESYVQRFSPIQDFVLIRRTDGEKKIGLIHIPEEVAHRHRRFEGKILAVGPGRFNRRGVRHPMPEIKAGDMVVFGRYAAAEASLSADHTMDDFLLIRAEELDAVIEP